MTAAVAAPTLTRERVARTARAIEPVLNRVVLAGPPVVDLLVNDAVFAAPELAFAADQTLQLLSTSMVDRLGADLQKAGFVRSSRAETGDRWTRDDAVSVDLVQVREAEGETADLWLEYATLMTLPLQVDDRITVRIAGAPAILAIELDAFSRGGEGPVDSANFERALLLIAGRMEIERELEAAPPELRSMVRRVLGAVASNDALPFLVQRAIPGASMFPALAKRVRERIVRMAC